MQVQSLGWEDPLEEGMAAQPSILLCRVPWTEEPGGLQSIESQRVGYHWSDWVCMDAYLKYCIVFSISYTKIWTSCLRFESKWAFYIFICKSGNSMSSASNHQQPGCPPHGESMPENETFKKETGPKMTDSWWYFPNVCILSCLNSFFATGTFL